MLYNVKQVAIGFFESMNQLLRTDDYLEFITKALDEGQVTWADLPFTEADLKATVLKCYVRRATELFDYLKARKYIWCNIEIRKLLQEGQVTWADLPFTEADLKAEERSESIYWAEIYYKKLKPGSQDIFFYRDITISDEICRRVNEGRLIWTDLSFSESELVEAERTVAIRAIVRYFELLQSKKITTYAKLLRRVLEKGKVTWADLPFTEADLKAQESTAKPPPPMPGMYVFS